MLEQSYINRQILEVKKGGAYIFLRKIFTLIKLIVFTPSYFFTLPFLLIIYLIRPWFLVRFGYLPSSRIGHFALNIELYLCEKEYGFYNVGKPYIDLFCFKEISNKQLAKMWKRKINILPTWILLPIINLNIFFKKLFSTCKVHETFENTDKIDDWHDLLDKSNPHLQFTKKEKIYGKKCLKQFGLSDQDKFVCLDVRDQAFLDKNFPEKEWKHHSLRNVELDNFLLAAEEIAKRGYYVFRMGKKVLKPLKTSNPKIIDYANLNLRSDFLDIFLGANCEFYIGSGSGFSSIPYIFRKPLARIVFPLVRVVKPKINHTKLVTGRKNETLYVDFGHSSRNGITLTKHYILKENKKELTLNEIFLKNLALDGNENYFLENGIIVKDPTSNEIKDMAIEMIDLLEKKWTPSKIDTELEEKVQSIFDKNINSSIFKIKVLENFKIKFTHVGKFKGKISNSYLRNNLNWLN